MCLVDVGADVRIDVGTDVCIDVGTDVRIDVGTDVRIDVDAYVRIDVGTDARIDVGAYVRIGVVGGIEIYRLGPKVGFMALSGGCLELPLELDTVSLPSLDLVVLVKLSVFLILASSVDLVKDTLLVNRNFLISKLPVLRKCCQTSDADFLFRYIRLTSGLCSK